MSGPGMSAGGAGRPGAGPGNAGRPSPNAGAINNAQRPGSARPGVGAGGVGGPDSGIGVRPGVGAGRPGVGAGGIGGPASGAGLRPGAGFGAPGTPARNVAAKNAGTYYANEASLAAQRDAVVAAGAYAAFTPAYLAGYGSAWQPTNMMSASLYGNPGYGALSQQLGMAAQPAAYDYGGNVVAQPSAVYVNGDLVGTPQQYSDQAAQIAASGAADPDANSKWQPLGVFAMVEGNETTSNDVFQLAVNKKGVIRGNYQNLETNETTPLAGSVDAKTQRAAWTIGGDKLPVYEAGIANLTKDQTTMLIHTADQQLRQFTLVRLPDPDDSSQPGGRN